MKAIIILNPNAHSGQASAQDETLRAEINNRLLAALPLEGIDWCETQHPGQGSELAENAVRNGYDYVFAAGGDGTINEVLNGIMRAKTAQKQRPVFGVLPFGTSNDFFAALKLAEAELTAETASDLTLPLDVGRVQLDTVERYFCLTMGIGLFSWANEQYLDASHQFGRRFAHLPAAIKTLLSYRFIPDAKFSHDGKRVHKTRILSLVVNNSPVIAGGIQLTPAAKINDGWFDVYLIKPVSLPQLIWLMLQVGARTKPRSRTVQLGRVQEISVTTRQALPVQLDGELVPEIQSRSRTTKVSILPAALRVVLPSLCEIVPKTP